MLRLNDDIAIIQTVDFFAPVVDDPYEFGMIAAANSMSDVFAMGGQVTMGLNIAAFPDELDLAILSEIFRGGTDKMQEAGGVIAGGHTVTDSEPKYGIAVTGTVHPDRLWTKDGARPGDVLLLTKPLGSGILTTAAKQDKIDSDMLQPAIEYMSRLNLYARNIAVRHEVHAATDVTGFGLFGHAHEMSERSHVSLNLDANRLPTLPHVHELILSGVSAGGLGRNRDHYMSLEGAVDVEAGVTAAQLATGFDPQTSGGILFAVPADAVQAFMADFHDHNEQIWSVGQVTGGNGIHIGDATSSTG